MHITLSILPLTHYAPFSCYRLQPITTDRDLLARRDFSLLTHYTRKRSKPMRHRAQRPPVLSTLGLIANLDLSQALVRQNGFSRFDTNMASGQAPMSIVSPAFLAHQSFRGKVHTDLSGEHDNHSLSITVRIYFFFTLVVSAHAIRVSFLRQKCPASFLVQTNRTCIVTDR